MKTSIIIPAYNEEARIKNSLNSLTDYMDIYEPDYEIIVVNDGSEDKTREVVLSTQSPRVMLMDFSRNMGKGHAVKKGITAATGDILLYTDADLAYSPHYITEAAKLLLSGANAVAGSRAFAGGYPLYRRAFSHTFSYMASKSLDLPYDTQCGFKAFTARAANEVFTRVTAFDYTFDVEVLLIAQKLNIRIDELFVVADYRDGSKVKPMSDAAKMVAGLFKIYKNNVNGLYGGN